MKVVAVEFLRSAASPADFPRDGLPQLALVGRSNVGKSTLINALTGRKVARTSAAPGKTRLLNLYRVQLAGRHPERLYLVDLPGYGYARGGEQSAAAFDRLVSAYFAQPPGGVAGTGGQPRPAGTARKAGDGPTAALLVVDARHPGLEPDVSALQWLHTWGRPVAVVATKVDKLSRAEAIRARNGWQKALNSPVMAVSAASGEGLDELWTEINRLLQGATIAPSGSIGPSAASAGSAPNGPSAPDAASAGPGAAARPAAPRTGGATSASSTSRRSRT